MQPPARLRDRHLKHFRASKEQSEMLQARSAGIHKSTTITSNRQQPAFLVRHEGVKAGDLLSLQSCVRCRQMASGKAESSADSSDSATPNQQLHCGLEPRRLRASYRQTSSSLARETETAPNASRFRTFLSAQDILLAPFGSEAFGIAGVKSSWGGSHTAASSVWRLAPPSTVLSSCLQAS